MKFEFSDLYKFFVSLGVVLITISVLTPWLFLREPFDLLKTADELAKLTPFAQEALSKRQQLVMLALQIIPVFSLTGISLGLLMGGYGLYRWTANQRIHDEKTRIELEISKQSLRDATEDEVEKHREYEASVIHGRSTLSGESAGSFKPTIVNEALDVEKQFLTRATSVYSKKYDVLTEKVINGAFVDIALQGKSNFTKDFLLEIKYIKKGFNYGWLREVALKLRYISSLYSQSENRIPNTILIVVSSSDVLNNKKYKSFQDKLAADRSSEIFGAKYLPILFRKNKIY